MMSLLFIGSSHIKRLESYIKRIDPVSPFSVRDVSIQFHGISGGRLCSSSHVNSFDRTISNLKPNALIIHIGGNDLDQPGMDIEGAIIIALRLVALCKQFVVKYNLQKIICVQLMARSNTRHVNVQIYNDLVIAFNRQLKSELSSCSNVIYWRLKGIKNTGDNLYQDGVHFNEIGLKKYYKNLRGAVLQCC